MISQIGKYPVQAKIGEGGMGVVYLAYDPDVGRPVAIKVLPAHSDPVLLKRFRDEVATTGNLTHKNIVVVYGSGTEYESGGDVGSPYLVMEWLLGQTLQEAIKNGQLQLLDKVRIMAQVAEGLQYAHSKNVIHRDVTPGNIMLIADGNVNVKIMDFGIARLTTRNTMITQVGYIVGSPFYMAPEQFVGDGSKADKQTDIFSYGTVFYELLTGKHPFSLDDNMYAAIARIQTFEPESVKSKVPECSDALDSLVHRAIEKRREARYQSFTELLADIMAIQSDLAHERAVFLLGEVSTLIEAGELDHAEDKLNEVALLAPANRNSRDLRKTIQNEKERRRNEARLPGLMEESADLLHRRRFAEAVSILETAVRLSPNDEKVREYLAEAKGKREAQRQASDLVSEARRDWQRGQLDDALVRLEAALELDPEHTTAGELGPRIRAEIEHRETDRREQEAVAAASACLERKQYLEALAKLESLGPGRATELRARIEHERNEDQKRQQAEQFELTASDFREALRSKDLTRAGVLLDQLSAEFTDQLDAGPYLRELRQQLEDQIRAENITFYSVQVRERIEQQWFQEALNLLAEALARYPEDAGLKRLQEWANALHVSSTVCNEAKRLRATGNVAQALKCVRDGLERIGDDAALRELHQQLEAEVAQQRYAAGLKDLLASVRSLVAAGNYPEALSAIEAAPAYREEAEVQAALGSTHVLFASQQEQRLVDATLDAVAAWEQQGKLDQALSLLQEGLAKYPSNPALSQAADRVTESIAKARRKAAIAGHRTRIEAAIQTRDWKAAKAAIQRGQAEYPEEPMFANSEEHVSRALFEAGLDDVVAQVGQNLAANKIQEAAELLERTRTIYSNDARWKALEQEISRRQSYERDLTEAGRLWETGHRLQAEQLLAALNEDACVDGRARELLVQVQNQRISGQIREAEQAIESGDFDRGLVLLEALRSGVPERWASTVDQAYQSALLMKQKEVERQRQERGREAAIARIAEEAGRLAAGGQLAKALSLLKDGQRQFPGTGHLQHLRDDLLAEARSRSLDLARGLHGERRFKEALHAVRTALEYAPGHPELLEVQARIERDHKEQLRADQQEKEFLKIEVRAESFLAKGRPGRAIALIESRYGSEPRFQKLLDRARTDLEQLNKAKALRPDKKHLRWLAIGSAMMLLAPLAWYIVHRPAQAPPPPKEITLVPVPDNLTFSYTIGNANPNPQFIDFKRVGIRFETSIIGDWLTVTPSNGDRLDRLKIDVNAQKLNVGVYPGTIIVRSRGQPVTNDLVVIQVRLEVKGVESQNPILLECNPKSLEFIWDMNIRRNPPDPRQISVRHADIGGAYTRSKWLQVTHDRHSVRVSILPQTTPGDYEGDVYINSAGPSAATADVPVHLKVKAAAPEATAPNVDPTRSPEPNPPPPLQTRQPEPTPAFPLPSCDGEPQRQNPSGIVQWVGDTELPNGGTLRILANGTTQPSGRLIPLSGPKMPFHKPLRITTTSKIKVTNEPIAENACMPAQFRNEGSAVQQFDFRWDWTPPK
jgi:serine/threonine protein kinase